MAGPELSKQLLDASAIWPKVDCHTAMACSSCLHGSSLMIIPWTTHHWLYRHHEYLHVIEYTDIAKIFWAMTIKNCTGLVIPSHQLTIHHSLYRFSLYYLMKCLKVDAMLLNHLIPSFISESTLDVVSQSLNSELPHCLYTYECRQCKSWFNFFKISSYTLQNLKNFNM